MNAAPVNSATLNASANNVMNQGINAANAAGNQNSAGQQQSNNAVEQNSAEQQGAIPDGQSQNASMQSNGLE